MVPWCLAAITALFALGVAWADRRGTGLCSQVIKIGSDRSFGVFLVHPMLLLAWMLGPAGWLSTRIPALWSTIFAIVAVTSGSLLVVELLRRSPLSLMLTGKRLARANASVHTDRSEPSVSAEPIRLGAGRM
jgi:peptidoglycan/LPS O-acetylase OafA/YrhL